MNRLRSSRSIPVSPAFADFTHVARHTFASVIALANNVSLPNVAKMLGHSSTRMTQHYAKVMNQSILKEMQGVEQQLSL